MEESTFGITNTPSYELHELTNQTANYGELRGELRGITDRELR